MTTGLIYQFFHMCKTLKVDQIPYRNLRKTQNMPANWFQGLLIIKFYLEMSLMAYM